MPPIPPPRLRPIGLVEPTAIAGHHGVPGLQESSKGGRIPSTWLDPFDGSEGSHELETVSSAALFVGLASSLAVEGATRESSEAATRDEPATI